MDFDLDDPTTAFAALGGTILDRARPDHDDRTTWSHLAGAGLFAAVMSDDVGGSGLGAVAVHLLLEHAGRNASSLPLLESLVLGAETLDRHGSAAQRERWLPDVAAGRVQLTAALDAPGPGDPLRPRCRLSTAARGLVLTGTISRVPHAQTADRVLVPAVTPDGATVVVLLDPRAPGVTCEPQQVVGGAPAALLTFDRVEVADSDVIGDDGNTVLADLVLRATAASASVQSGLCAGALDLAATHVRVREQFGRPIGTFQAVRQRLADAWIDAGMVRVTALAAADRLAASPAPAADADAVRAVTVAAWWAADAGHRVMHAAQHVHGGSGIDLGHPLPRYFALAAAARFSVGTAERHLQALGRALVDAG